MGAKVRIINKSLYPTKWEEYLKLYEEIEAIEKYYGFCRSFCLEKYILNFGIEEGTKKYNEKKKNANYGVTLEKSIKKYGLEKGTEIYNTWKKNVGGTLKRFIERHGEEEGTIRYKQFQKKCIITDEIKNDKNSTYNLREFNTRLEYYIKKGFSEEEAKKILSDRQSTTSLEKFIKLYGEEIGLKKYIECNKKKSNTLENYIEKFGEIIGIEKHLKFLEIQKEIHNREKLILKHGIEKYEEICKSHAVTLEKFIKKHGEKNGTEKYANYLKTRINIVSKASLILFDQLYNFIKNDFENIYYGINEYFFFLNSKNIKCAKPDFYIKDINLAIEFYGDYWHRNPVIKKYNTEQDNLVRNRDTERIRLITEKFNTEVIIIWQQDFSNNPLEIIKNLINIIKNKKK